MNNIIEFPTKEIERNDLRKEFAQRLSTLSAKKYDLMEYIESVENYGMLMLSDPKHPLNEDELLGCDLYNIVKYYFGHRELDNKSIHPSG